MKKAKKQIGLILAAVLVFLTLSVPALAAAGTSYTPAAPVQYDFYIDGGKSAPLWAYEIEGSAYFRLRDLAMVLIGTEKQFEISWDQGKNAVSLTAGTAYTPIGNEMSKPPELSEASGDIGAVAYSPTTLFYIDNRQVPIRAYIINGSHYIMLADLAANLMFAAGRDEEQHAVKIITFSEENGQLKIIGIDGFNNFPGYNAVRESVPLPESAALLASLPDEPIAIYGDKNSLSKYGDLYEGLYLSINGVNKYFEWETEVGTFDPELILEDLSGDGQKELAVILTAGSGTGVHLADIHVIDPETFKETQVADQLDIISKSVTSSIVHENGRVTITITVDGKKYVTALDEDDSLSWAEDKAVFGNIVRYAAEDGRLKATVPAQISIAGFAGDVNITYAFDGNHYGMDTIEYVPYDK